MPLTKFGAEVRANRRALNETLNSMAIALQTSTAFLSAMETGRSKVPMEWVDKISDFFLKNGLTVNVKKLRALACESNESVSLTGLPPQHQMLIAGFANSELNHEQLKKFGELLAEIYGEKVKDGE